MCCGRWSAAAFARQAIVCVERALKGVELVRLVVAIPVFLGATVPDKVAGVVRQPCSPVDLAQRLCRVSRDIGTGIVAERRSAADHTDHMLETLGIRGGRS